MSRPVTPIAGVLLAALATTAAAQTGTLPPGPAAAAPAPAPAPAGATIPAPAPAPDAAASAAAPALSGIIRDLEGRGYRIGEVDVDETDIEIEARDATGRRVEVRVEPATGAVLSERADN